MNRFAEARVRGEQALTRWPDASAEALLQEWSAREAQDRFVTATYKSSAEALVDIQHGNPARAIERLRLAAPYELSYGPELLPIYVRGLRTFSLKDGSTAATESGNFSITAVPQRRRSSTHFPVSNRRARSRWPAMWRGVDHRTKHF
jgi:hypothetical protein